MKCVFVCFSVHCCVVAVCLQSFVSLQEQMKEVKAQNTPSRSGAPRHVVVRRRPKDARWQQGVSLEFCVPLWSSDVQNSCSLAGSATERRWSGWFVHRARCGRVF